MIKEIIILTLITFIPFFELRASIPVGILKGSVDLPFGLTLSGFGMPWWQVIIICVIANMIVGPVVYLLLYYLTDRLIKYKWFAKPYIYFVNKKQKKIQTAVDRWGELGLAIFIAVPLPGTGSYTGALGAYLLGLKLRKFIVANCIGVLIAGILVTMITLGLMSGAEFLL